MQLIIVFEIDSFASQICFMFSRRIGRWKVQEEEKKSATGQRVRLSSGGARKSKNAFLVHFVR